MKNKFGLFSIMVLFVVILMTSCESSSKKEETTTINDTVLTTTSSDDRDTSSTTSVVKDYSLVDGSNLAYSPKMSADGETLTLEQLVENTIAYANTCTLVVQNYQTIYRKQYQWTGSGYSIVTNSEHVMVGFGSGVIYYKAALTDGGYLYKLITNEHVVDGDSLGYNVNASEAEYKIYDENYEETITATLVGKDANADIAVLEFTSDREYNAVKFERQNDVKAGKFVVAVGTPLDFVYYNTATFGIISKVKDTYIQHDASINSGNSGGPLFDIYGNLVGLNNSKLSGFTSSGSSIDGIFFAIPLNIINDSIEGITGLSEVVYVE